jgi:hypothetical protein
VFVRVLSPFRCEWHFACSFIERLSGPTPGNEATMTPEETGQHRDSGAHKGKLDWVFIGSLILIFISLLGMAYIAWTRYGLAR